MLNTSSIPPQTMPAANPEPLRDAVSAGLAEQMKRTERGVEDERSRKLEQERLRREGPVSPFD